MEWGLYFTVVGLGMMGWDDRLWIVVGKAYVGGWLEVVKEWYEYRREASGTKQRCSVILSCYSITMALALALVIQR